jgi:hypothetical protein
LRDQQRRRKPDQLGRERRQAIQASLGVSVLDRDIPADDKAPLLQSLEERGPLRCFGLRGAAAKIPDHRQARLRRGPERRESGRAADHREELAAVHVWMAPALQEVISITSSARASRLCAITHGVTKARSQGVATPSDQRSECGSSPL